MDTHKRNVSFHLGLLLFSDSLDFIFCWPILITIRYCRSLFLRIPVLGRSASITMTHSIEINVHFMSNRRRYVPFICEISNVDFSAGRGPSPLSESSIPLVKIEHKEIEMTGEGVFTGLTSRWDGGSGWECTWSSEVIGDSEATMARVELQAHYHASNISMNGVQWEVSMLPRGVCKVNVNLVSIAFASRSGLSKFFLDMS